MRDILTITCLLKITFFKGACGELHIFTSVLEISDAPRAALGISSFLSLFVISGGDFLTTATVASAHRKNDSKTVDQSKARVQKHLTFGHRGRYPKTTHLLWFLLTQRFHAKQSPRPVVFLRLCLLGEG